MTLEEIERQFPDVSEKTRVAYDKLNGRAGRGGLYAQLRGAKETLKKKGLLKGVKERTEAEILGLESAIKEAEVEYNKFQTQKNLLTREFNKLKKAEEEGKLKEVTAKGAGNVYQKALEGLKEAELSLQGYKGDTRYQDAYRKAQAAYETAVSSGLRPTPIGTPRIPVPPVEVKTADGKTGTEEEQAKDDLSAFISTLADPANAAVLKAVQEDFARNFGYKGPVDGLYSLPFQNALDTIARSRSSLPESLQGKDFRTFIADSKSAQLLGTTATGAGGGSGGTRITNYISDATAAAATVNSVIKGLLSREATEKEVKDLSTILIDAQKKNPYRETNGIRTGGINEVQLLTDVIKSGVYAGSKKLGKLDTLGKLSSELSTKKKDVRTITGEDIMATANANGITLSPSQLQAYTQQVENGTDVNIIKRNIRNSAALGMPANIQQLIGEGTDLETIFAPYRSRMSAILEIAPDSINLNDPTLRSAIGPDKEMSLYDFQRQLRKDPRWQYTDNAREVVSSGLTQVLKDFGFMG